MDLGLLKWAGVAWACWRPTPYTCSVRSPTPRSLASKLPFVRVADVLGGSLMLKEGHFAVPDGPGLGVELDMEVVEAYRVG